jgi:hypothetical protein
VVTVTVRAWAVQDSGLVAVPGPFRRLPGAVRHLQGRGEPWPSEVTLTLTEHELVVAGVGSWPRADVRFRWIADGPPVTFVVDVPSGAHLLAAPADDATTALLASGR